VLALKTWTWTQWIFNNKKPSFISHLLSAQPVLSLEDLDLPLTVLITIFTELLDQQITCKHLPTETWLVPLAKQVDSLPKDRKEIIIIIIRILRYWIISNHTERGLVIKRVIILKEVKLMGTRASSEVDYLTIQTYQAIHQLKWKEVQAMAKQRINNSSKIFIWIWIRVLDLPTTLTICPS